MLSIPPPQHPRFACGANKAPVGYGYAAMRFWLWGFLIVLTRHATPPPHPAAFHACQSGLPSDAPKLRRRHRVGPKCVTPRRAAPRGQAV